MVNREKVDKGLECCSKIDICCMEIACHHPVYLQCPYHEADDCVLNLIKDAYALLKERQQTVRCKDCVHRGNAEKCVLAAISEEKNFPLFMLDNRGEWFCADGVARNINVPGKEGR